MPYLLFQKFTSDHFDDLIENLEDIIFSDDNDSDIFEDDMLDFEEQDYIELPGHADEYLYY